MPDLQTDGKIDFGQNGASPTNWRTDGTFEVGTNLTVDGTTTLTGAQTLTGATTCSSTLAVTGAATITGATNANGGVDRSSAAALTVGGTNATSVTIGKAGASAGNGVRNAASRNIVGNKPTAPVDIAGGVTATVTQLLEAGIFLCSASATLTLPSAQGAAGIVQNLPGTPAVGDVFTFVIAPATAQTATLAVGTGITISGIATCTASRTFYARVTSVTANSETLTIY